MKQKYTKKTLYTSISTIYLGQISGEHVPHWCRQNCLPWAASSTTTWPGDPPPVRTPKEWMKSDASHAYGMTFCFRRQSQVHTAPHQGHEGRAERWLSPMSSAYSVSHSTRSPETQGPLTSSLNPCLFPPIQVKVWENASLGGCPKTLTCVLYNGVSYPLDRVHFGGDCDLM